MEQKKKKQGQNEKSKLLWYIEIKFTFGTIQYMWC